jgi:hypothetical protein
MGIKWVCKIGEGKQKMDKEQLIFELYKDKPISNTTEFKKMLNGKFKVTDVMELYVKIVNYQIDRYGMSLRNTVDMPTHEEKMYLKDKNNARKYQNRRYRERRK